MQAPFRRGTADHAASGGAMIIADNPPPRLRTSDAQPGFRPAGVPAADRMRVPVHRHGEPTDRLHQLAPPEGRTVCHTVAPPPDAAWLGRLGERGAGQTADGTRDIGATTQPHPIMRRTRSVGCGIDRSGEIHLVVGDGEGRLQAGDVTVQRGTSHVWSCRNDGPPCMTFIPIDGAWKE